MGAGLPYLVQEQRYAGWLRGIIAGLRPLHGTEHDWP